MTNRGYKRGLALSATAALAITGLPFFAGTAHAAPGDADDMTLTAGSNSVPTGGSTTVTARVTKTGNPVNGITVFWDQNNNGTDDAAPADPAATTNPEGRATFNNVTAGTQYFIADLNNNGQYDDGIDIKRSIVIGTYSPNATTAAATSRDGAAFDIDEYEGFTAAQAGPPAVPADPGDIVVQVKDQNGNPQPGQTVRYSWIFDAFGPTAPVGPTPERTAVTDANGYATIDLAADYAGGGTYTLSYYVNTNGTPGQQSGDVSGTPLTIKTGQANIIFDAANPQQAVVGGEATVSGKLVLGEGTSDETGLPSRPIRLVASAGDNAAFNQPTGADNRTYTTTTDANGAFTSVLDDPNGDQAPETDTVTASTDPWTHDGDTDNANDSSQTQVQFVQQVQPTNVFVDVNNAANNADSSTGNADTAGKIENIVVNVTRGTDDPATGTDERTPVANQLVTLTTDKGYFTDGAKSPAVGDYTTGVNNDKGQSITVRTDSNGNATAKLSIGRDAGFDDDGQVTATITATANGTSGTDSAYWTSNNPLNAGEVTVDLAPNAQQDSKTLPDARTGTPVRLVVKAFDQFGNRVGGQAIPLSSSGVGTVTSPATTGFTDAYNATASSAQAGTQTVTATWTYTSNQYVTDGPDAGTAPDTQSNSPKTDSVAINWYDGTVTNATVTMDDNTGGVANVGETVTETVTVKDQKGNPVQGATVEFVRSGPNAQQGDVNYTTTTDANGIATYNFKGDTAGTADISAVIRVAGSQVATKQDSVRFGSTRVAINAVLSGGNNGKRDDVLTVNGPNAARGAVVRLYRIRANGTRVLLRTKTANRYGNAAFVVDDLNGRKFTKYRAYVGTTPRTRADWTNFKSVR